MSSENNARSSHEEEEIPSAKALWDDMVGAYYKRGENPASRKGLSSSWKKGKYDGPVPPLEERRHDLPLTKLPGKKHSQAFVIAWYNLRLPQALEIVEIIKILRKEGKNSPKLTTAVEEVPLGEGRSDTYYVSRLLEGTVGLNWQLRGRRPHGLGTTS